MSGNGNGKQPRLDEQGKSIRELELEIELARLRREEAAPGQEIVVLDEAGAAAAASAQIAQPAAQIAESGAQPQAVAPDQLQHVEVAAPAQAVQQAAHPRAGTPGQFHLQRAASQYTPAPRQALLQPPGGAQQPIPRPLLPSTPHQNNGLQGGRGGRGMRPRRPTNLTTVFVCFTHDEIYCHICNFYEPSSEYWARH